MPSKEFEQFSRAMDSILRANPIEVKALVDAEIKANTAEREARGERKRGRKAKVQPSASGRASSAKH